MEHALDRAPEPEGYVRLFLDEGPPMLALLHAAAVGECSGGSDVVRRTPDDSSPPPPALSCRPRWPPAESRWPTRSANGRIEVLRRLDSDLTGPEIARQLFVSLNTLRTHTKRIFTKLDVTNRSAAVRRARELGLL